MRSFCIHRGKCYDQKKIFKNGNYRLVIPKGAGRTIPGGISQEAIPAWKGPSKQGLGDVQGTVVALGTRVQQDKCGWVHPIVLLRSLGMALCINLHLSQSFPPSRGSWDSSVAEMSPPGVWHCLHCVTCGVILDILTGNSDPKSTQLPLPGNPEFPAASPWAAGNILV